VNAEAWIVLSVGAGTVIAQLYAAKQVRDTAKEQTEAAQQTAQQQTEAARRQASAAELQSEAAQAALDRELSAVLIAERCDIDPDVAHVILHNGGLHSASDVTVTWLDDADRDLVAVWKPVVRASESTDFEWQVLTDEYRERFRHVTAIRVRWKDGRGETNEARLVLLFGE
jgi:hypothetical protein